MLTKAEFKTVLAAQTYVEINDTRYGTARLIKRLLKIIARLTTYK